MEQKNRNYEIWNDIWKRDTLDYKFYSAGNLWHNARVKAMMNLINPDDIRDIADIGCGNGVKTAMLARLLPNAQVDGFDFTKEAVISAGRNFSNISNLNFFHGDIEACKSLQKKYQMIVSFETLEHITDWENMIDEMTALYPDYFLFSFPVGKMMKNEWKVGHIRHFKYMEVETCLRRKGYQKVETEYAGFPFYYPLCTTLQYVFLKEYIKEQTNKMSYVQKCLHYVVYLLFQYCSTKKRYGGSFIGLFKRMESETV